MRRGRPTKATVDVVDLGDGVKATRFTMEPGWRWSECVKPVVGTDRCQVRHMGAVLSGRIHVVHDDGTETEAGPNDAYRIEPYHLAWVVGDEPLVAYESESSGAATYGAAPD